MPCTCKHRSQDELHGSGKKVHNTGKTHMICTVCGSTKLKPQKKEDKKEDKK